MSTSRLRRLPLVTLPLLALATACGVEPMDADTIETEADVSTDEAALRRSDFGQSRALSVRDQTNTWRSGMLPPYHGTGTLTTASGALQSAGVTRLHALSWVGDANSYIDVFDQDFVSPQVWLPGTSPQFVRTRYPWPSDAKTTFYFPLGGRTTPVSTPRALNVELPTGRTWKAFRHYDRGECSFETPWSTFLDGLKTSLTTKLTEGFAEKGLTGATLASPMVGSLQIVPSGTGDIYRVRATYDVHRCYAKMDLAFAIRIDTYERAPRVRLEGSPTVRFDFGDDVCGGLAALSKGFGTDAGALQRYIEGEVRTELALQLASSIQKALVARMAQPASVVPCREGDDGDAACLNVVRFGLNNGFDGRAPNPAAASALAPRNAKCLPMASGENAGRPMCHFVPNVERIHTRPDGMELVFADLRTDPFYSLLAPARVCSRPEPSASAPVPPVVAQSWGPTSVR